MNNELQSIIDQFLKILHIYSVINRKPQDFGTGDTLYFTEIHTISMVGRNKEVNMTRLADLMGVTKGAISQTVQKLVKKDYIVKSNSRNLKEVNLRLTEKGMSAFRGQETFQREVFSFAESLYQKVSPDQADLVKRLFIAITENMQQRAKELA
jgi:DNA-binding MarR family transcriptional regulator